MRFISLFAIFAIFALVLFLLPHLAQAEDPTAVAVMEFASKGGVTQEQMDALGDMLANNIRSAGNYKVIGKSDIRAALNLESQKQLLGCSDESCIAEIGGALGVRWVVLGNISQFGELFLLNLKLLDVDKVTVLQGISKKIEGGQAALIDALPVAAAELMKAAEQGMGTSPKDDSATASTKQDDKPIPDPTKPDPSKTDPSKTYPSKTDPGKTDPGKTDPGKTDPGKIDPVKTNPVKTNPVKTNPVKTNPVKTNPVKTDPSQAGPVKVGSASMTDVSSAAPARASSSYNLWGHIGLWSGVAALAASGAFFAMSKKKANDYFDRHIFEAADDSRQWAGMAWGVLSLGVALATTGVTLWMLEPDEPGIAATISPTPNGGAMLGIGGRW